MQWLRSRKFIIAAAAIFGLAVAGVGWFIAAQTHPHSTYQAPLPKPTSSSAAGNAMSVGRTPDAPLKLPPGYTVHVFADKLGSARDLAYSPGGTLLVSNPNDGKILALPDTNHDGAADSVKTVLSAGDNPHGLAFYKGRLYVAFTTSVKRYNWDESTLTASLEKDIAKLPPNSDHNKRTIIFDPSGQMFVSVGSTCNVCREDDSKSATIQTADANGYGLHMYATGLRNAPFMAFNPATGDMWVTEMGRDNLGDDVPPDEINVINNGKNYGWPFCYGDRIHDTDFDKSSSPVTPGACGSTIPPIYQIPAHSSPLGLAFIKSGQFPADQQGDLLVAYHGSWNRSVPDGYKIVRLKVSGNSVTDASDFMTGFISGRDVKARPVDLTFNDRGDLFVSDDKTGSVYIVQKQP